jgi:hypothetical protein
MRQKDFELRSRSPRARLALASLIGVLALFSWGLVTYFIARDSWGSVVQYAWLRPGARFVSLEYALCVLTSAVFVVGGVLAHVRPAAALPWTAGGFVLTLGCFEALTASVPWSVDDLLIALLVFVLPALWFFAGARRARLASRV